MRRSRAEADGTFADARPSFARALGQESTGWGATWADLDLDGDLELALANGAIPVTEPRRRRRAPPARAVGGRRASGRSRRARSRRGTAAGSPRPTTTTTATSTSPSARSAAGCSSCGTTGPKATGSRSRGSSPARRSRRRSTTAGSSCDGSMPAAATCPRRIRASTSGSGDAARVRELVMRHPGGEVTRLRDVAADRSSRSGAEPHRNVAAPAGGSQPS